MNYLTSLDKYLFKDLKNLVELELEYNKLESLDSGIFDTTRSLKELSLDNNQLAQLDGDKINKLCLERLSLEENKMSTSYDVRRVKKCMVIAKKSERGGSGDFTQNHATKNQINNVAFFFVTLGIFILV